MVFVIVNIFVHLTTFDLIYWPSKQAFFVEFVLIQD